MECGNQAVLLFPVYDALVADEGTIKLQIFHAERMYEEKNY